MKKLFKEKIFSYESLKENIFKNDLAFFSKSQNENIRRGIKLYASYKGKFLLSEGQSIFEEIQNKYHDVDFRQTGGLRRCDEVLDCIELIYICDPGFDISNFASSLKKIIPKACFIISPTLSCLCVTGLPNLLIFYILLSITVEL